MKALYLSVALWICLASSASAATVSGIITYSDGSPYANATVEFKSTINLSTRFETTTDETGHYSLALTDGDYEVFAVFEVGGFKTGGTLLAESAVSFTGETNTFSRSLNDITLSGTIVDPEGNAVPGAKFDAIAFASGSGFDDICVFADESGEFEVRIVPNDYLNLKIEPPAGSQLLSTALPNRSFTEDISLILVLKEAVVVSGVIAYSDGSPFANAVIEFRSTVNRSTTFEASTDANGAYSLSLPTGDYEILAVFEAGGFRSNGTLLSETAVSFNGANNTFSSNLNDITLSGTVVDSDGNAVPGAKFDAIAFASGSGFDDICVFADESGEFEVRIVPNDYLNLKIEPPAGSQLLSSALPNRSFTEDTSLNLVLKEAVMVSGVIAYSDGSPFANAVIEFRSTVNRSTTFEASTDANGAYSLSLPSGDYEVLAVFEAGGFRTGGTLLSETAISFNGANSTFASTLNDITLSGTIVDLEGKGVSGAKLDAIAFASGSGFDDICVLTDQSGVFEVRIMPNDYFSLKIEPPAGSAYLETPLPNRSFTQNSDLRLVIGVADFLTGFLADSIQDQTRAGAFDDADDDNLANIAEFYFKTNPNAPSADDLVSFSPEGNQNSNGLKIRYQRNRDRGNVIGRVQWSRDLTLGWFHSGESDGTMMIEVIETVISEPSANPEIVEAELVSDIPLDARLFVQVEISTP